MEAVIEALSSIARAIGSIINFVTDLASQLLDMVVMIGEAAATIPKLFGILPPVLTASFAAVLAIAVLYKILGRE